jgi:pimeloyl-ACP methyl ester carboxylesterase
VFVVTYKRIERRSLSLRRPRSKITQKVGLVSTVRRPTKTLTPLIFIPGIMASSLATKTVDGYLDYFWPPPYGLSLVEKGKKMLSGLQSGIRSKPDDKVSVEAMGLYPLAYDYLIKSIEMRGYTLNVNFWVFPYDWRQSSRISGKLLADFIMKKVNEGTVNQNGVDIINHSMGGFVTRAAVMIYGAPIKHTVYIASPHYGCPLSYFGLHPDIPFDEFPQFINLPPIDDTLRVPLEIAGNSISNMSTEDAEALVTTSFNDQLEDAFRRFPSMYELLPDYYYLKSKPVLFVDTKPIYSVEETYLNNEWKFGEDSVISKVKDAMKFKKEELGEKLPGNKEDILIIYGIDEPTDDTIVYQRRFFISGIGTQTTHSETYEFSYPYDSGLGGDTWVPKLSAMGSMSGIPHTNSKAIRGTHTLLPNDINAIEAALGFVIGNGGS